MKRALPVLFGVLPALVLLLIAHSALDREAQSRRAAATPKPAPQSRSEARPPPNTTDLLSSWSSASESTLETVAFLQTLDAPQLEALLAKLDLAPADRDSAECCQMIFDRLVDCNRKAALAYADKRPFEERLELMGYLLADWSIKDPNSCWEWYERQQTDLTEKEGEALHRAISEARWNEIPTERELAAAWRTIEENPAEVSYSAHAKRFLWPLVNEARESGAWEAVAKRIASTPNSGVGALWPIMHQWLDADFEGAIVWVSSLPSGNERSAALRAMSWDPDPVPLRGRFDRGRLSDALLALGDSSFSQSFRTWAGRQPVEAGEWLTRNQEQSPNLALARESYARLLAPLDIEASMAWTASLPTEDRRKSHRRQTIRYWYDFEPWAAEAWVRENLGLSGEELADYVR